jgi:hypothetical protein
MQINSRGKDSTSLKDDDPFKTAKEDAEKMVKAKEESIKNYLNDTKILKPGWENDIKPRNDGNKNTIYVHMVQHTHTDVGWLRTPE